MSIPRESGYCQCCIERGLKFPVISFHSTTICLVCGNRGGRYDCCTCGEHKELWDKPECNCGELEPPIYEAWGQIMCRNCSNDSFVDGIPEKIKNVKRRVKSHWEEVTQDECSAETVIKTFEEVGWNKQEEEFDTFLEKKRDDAGINYI